MKHMKKIQSLFTILLFLVFAFSYTSCGNKAKSEQDKTEQSTDAEKQGKEYTSAYICPMHCEGSGSDKPGDCPVCGMAYKKNENNTQESAESHDHDGHDHEGHDHEGHNHD